MSSKSGATSAESGKSTNNTKKHATRVPQGGSRTSRRVTDLSVAYPEPAPPVFTRGVASEAARSRAEQDRLAHKEDRKAHQKRGRKRKREELERSYQLAPVVSKPELRQLMVNMEPTERKRVELEYQLLLADPVHGEKVGIPLAIGGVPGASTKVRMFSAQEFSLPEGHTEFCVGIYQNRSPQGIGQDRNPLDYDSSILNQIHLPAVTNVETVSVDPEFIAFLSLDHGDVTSGEAGVCKTGLLNSNATHTISVDDPGLDLRGTMGRVVAQEIRIYPTSPILNAQGIGTLFQSASNSSTSLNDKNYDDLYGEQALTRETFPLAGWRPGSFFRAVKVPQTPEDLNFVQCDWSERPSGNYPQGFGGVGPYWAVFFATGLADTMTFRVEVTTVYEFLSNKYSFNTLNTASGGGLESVQPMESVIPPHVITEEEIANHAASAVGKTQSVIEGPKHTAAIAQHAANGSFSRPASDPIQDFGETLVGGLLEAGLGLLL